MTTPIRWGILGPGSIAHKFAVGLQATSKGELVRRWLARSAARRRLCRPVRCPQPPRLVRSPLRRSRHRRGVRGHPSPLPQRQFDSLPRSWQGRALREAVYHQRH